MNQKEREILILEENFRDTIENDIAKNQSENKKTEIKDIKLVGQATWKDKISGKNISDNVFIVEKEIIETDENGKERVTEQKSYYLGNRCVAGTLGNYEIVYNKSFAESEIDKQKAINDLIDKISEKEIEKNSMNKLKTEEMKEILTEYLGRKITEEELPSLLEKMDNQEIEEVQGKIKNKENKEEENNKLSKKQTDKIKVNQVQRIDLEQKADGVKELGKKLDLDGYRYIYVVYSENVKEIKQDENINNTTYSLVGIKDDGTASVMNNEFEMDKTVGNNAGRLQTKIKANGTATRDNKDSSVFVRKSNGMTIGCENDMGTVRVSLGQKTLQENENTEIELRTSNTGYIPIETRRVFKGDKGIYQIDKIQDKVEEHTQNGCKPKDVRDFDGDENTETHEHIDMDYYVQDILNYENEEGEEKIKEVFTEKGVKDKLLRELEKSKDKLTVEQIIENVKIEMNSDAENFEREHKK